MPTASTKMDLRRKRSVETRKQLIQSTLNVISRRGLAGTTLSTVSEESGLARSSVGFHFKSKDQMLTAALESLLQQYRKGWLNINEHEQLSAAQKLEAIVEWELGNVACTRKNVAVWFAFWGEVTTRSIYKKLVSKSDTEYHRTMKSLFMQLENDDVKAETLTLGLSSMIVGLWMDYHIGSYGFKRSLAIQTCLNYLHAEMPEHF